MPDTEKKVLSLAEIAWKHRNRKTDKAIQLNEETIRLAETIKAETLFPKLYNQESVFLELIGKYPESLTAAFKAIKIGEKYNNQKELAYAHNNIANVNFRLADYSTTAEYAKKSLSLFTNIKDSSGMAYATLRLAEATSMLQQYDKAIEYAQNGLNIRLAQADSSNLITVYTILGKIYAKQNKLTEALTYLERSRELATRLNNEKGLLNSLNATVAIYLIQKKYEEAKKMALQSLALTQKIAIKVHLKDTYKNLAEVYYAEENYEKALEYQTLFVNYKKEIYNEEKAILISTLTHQHQSEEELAHLNLLRKQAEKDKIILYAASIFAILLVFMLVFVLYNTAKQRKLNKTLGKQQNELKNKNELAVQLIDELNDKTGHIIASIQYAKRIQRAVFISEEKLKTIFEHSFIFFSPKEIVSGDFYWASEHEVWDEDGTLFKNKILVVGDCTGHGVPGGFISLIASSALDQIVHGRGIYSPDYVLLEIHNMLRDLLRADETESDDSIDMSFCYFDYRQQLLLFSGATQPLYYMENGEVQIVKGDKKKLGGLMLLDENLTFTLHQIPLQEKGRVYLATDGYIDQLGGEHRKKFSVKSFTQLLKDVHQLPCAEQKQTIDTTFKMWTSNNYKQMDDIVIIGVRT